MKGGLQAEGQRAGSISHAPSVAAWAAVTGLDPAATEELQSMAHDAYDLLYLTENEWAQALAPMRLKRGKLRRVRAAIVELQQAHYALTKAALDEDSEVIQLREMLFGGYLARRPLRSISSQQQNTRR